MKEIGGWQKHEKMLEFSDLLEQNFLIDNAGSPVRSQMMKQFRLEAVRAGFKKAWQDRDYQTIINIAEKIPEKVLQEDSRLLMWYDQAVTRAGS